ncbi:hypothetical protein ABE10_06215, partial [Bacillus toyonensis]|nr:hypothetical protein [Bacillus toyonensis]
AGGDAERLSRADDVGHRREECVVLAAQRQSAAEVGPESRLLEGGSDQPPFEPCPHVGALGAHGRLAVEEHYLVWLQAESGPVHSDVGGAGHAEDESDRSCLQR